MHKTLEKPIEKKDVNVSVVHDSIHIFSCVQFLWDSITKNASSPTKRGDAIQ